MRRFFFDEHQRRGAIVILSNEESHHIRRVLRLQKGQIVELLDRRGGRYQAEIAEESHPLHLRIIAQQQVRACASVPVAVGIAGVKAKNMELMLQKCTELGVSDFYPFISSRCQGNLLRQYSGRQERWRRIIEESCKQCGRPQPMELHALESFQKIRDRQDTERPLRLILWEREPSKSLAAIGSTLTEAESVVLLIGPEGGFTDEEIASASSVGWQTIGLGRSILRAETAAIAAVSIVQHYLGQI